MWGRASIEIVITKNNIFRLKLSEYFFELLNNEGLFSLSPLPMKLR